MARKNFGENWWAKRWIGVLESFGWSSRLQRGRTYARAGKVLESDVSPGLVTARVRGTVPKPYKVDIKIKQLTGAEWDKVLEALSGQAIFAAMLLAGEMPQEIESAFAGVQLSLFPQSSSDITTSCSCPDWANPCKHIAAVYYLLGEEFDNDPFLIFRLRGRSKEQIIEALREKRAVQAAVGDFAMERVEQSEAETETGVEDDGLPLADCLDNFWEAGPDFDRITVNISPSAVPGAILKTLGSSALGQDGKDFQKFMEEVYREISNYALEIAYRENEALEKI